MIKLWSVAPNGALMMNKDEEDVVQSIAAFRALYKLFSGEDDKAKHFLYIWHMADYRSLGVIRGYTGKELHNYAVKQSGLTNAFKATDIIRNAVEAYKVHEEDVIEEQFRYIKIVHHNTGRMLALLSKSIEDLLMKGENGKLTSTQEDDLHDKQSRVAKITVELPKYTKSLNELEAALAEHRSKKKNLRGKGDYRESMDNDRV